MQRNLHHCCCCVGRTHYLQRVQIEFHEVGGVGGVIETEKPLWVLCTRFFNLHGVVFSFALHLIEKQTASLLPLPHNLFRPTHRMAMWEAAKVSSYSHSPFGIGRV